jgi:hypothetical protein
MLGSQRRSIYPHLFAPHPQHTREHTNQGRGAIQGYLRMPLRDVLGLSVTHIHLVWGRVVPDIPEFCRELVAALAEG